MLCVSLWVVVAIKVALCFVVSLRKPTLRVFGTVSADIQDTQAVRSGLFRFYRTKSDIQVI